MGGFNNLLADWKGPQGGSWQLGMGVGAQIGGSTRVYEKNYNKGYAWGKVCQPILLDS